MLKLVLLLASNVAVALAADTGFFWHITDIHVTFKAGPSPASQPFGQQGTPEAFSNGLYTNLTNAMRQKNTHPDFILLTGDISAYVPDIIEASRLLKKAIPTPQSIFLTETTMSTLASTTGRMRAPTGRCQTRWKQFTTRIQQITIQT